MLIILAWLPILASIVVHGMASTPVNKPIEQGSFLVELGDDPAEPKPPDQKRGKGAPFLTFKALLKPCCGDALSEVEGDAGYRKRFHKGKVGEERFEVKVRFPVSGTGLGILGITSPEDADIRVQLSDGTGSYAVCYLGYLGIGREYMGPTLGYKRYHRYMLDVRWQLPERSDPRLQELNGRCETGVSTAGIQAGVPTVKAGDKIAVTLFAVVSDPLTGVEKKMTKDFLQGSFN